MKKQGVFFETAYNENLGIEQNAFTVSIIGDAGDYLLTMEALLNLLGGAKEDFIDEGDRLSICELIKSMLPNYEQLKWIEKAQKNNNKEE